jgi:hypothetical protein
MMFDEAKIDLPSGACPNCGGEGQEQWIDAAGEPAARTCKDCRGTGNAKNLTNYEIGNALAATNSWIETNADSIGEHFFVIRDALREVLATRSWIDSELLDLAICFRIGELYVEHIVDTDGNDYGWVVKKDGKWEQREGLTRDQAIAEARARNSIDSSEKTTLAAKLLAEAAAVEGAS